ncbi:MAG TPA: DUF4157 domain-containing protein [Thermoanaerobaculia bacterium]|nr:DUF4157 domain-containing protein [Thermoanaerobaculia bacterium]
MGDSPPIALTDSARLHSGAFAHLAARLLRARAFVVGRHVFLSRGSGREIARGSPAGRVLLAHELVHVEQYARLGVARFLRLHFADDFRSRARGLSHAAAYDAIVFEREAEERAAEVAAGLNPEGSRGDRPRGA